MPLSATHRRDLLQMFHAALQRVEGAAAVEHALAGIRLHDAVSLIAVGKAAPAMAAGATAALGERLVDGLLVTRTGYLDENLPASIRCIESEHPVPGEKSLMAGEALVDYCQALPADRQAIFCLSGGASSLVEALRPGYGLEDLQRLNKSLLGSGAPIRVINARRRALSRIKGGQLAKLLRARPVEVLVISDVQGDDLAVIGSGPLFDSAGGDPRIRHRLVATQQMARAAACEAARARGYVCHCHDEFLGGEIGAIASKVSQTLSAGKPGIHVWGGEPVVNLPPDPGRGGRNQHLALLLANRLRGRDDWMALVAGTDGSDGATLDAGALVDGGTVSRGENAGGSVETALKTFASGEFLAHAGDLVTTGPTGTNVMDLVIALRGGDELSLRRASIATSRNGRVDPIQQFGRHLVLIFHFRDTGL